MSLKGPLRRLDDGVRWLETEGMYINIKNMMKTLEMLLDIADRADVDPAFAADWNKSYPYIVLLPPRRMGRASQPRPEAAPPPERVPVRASERPPAPPPVAAPQPIVPEAPPSPRVESPLPPPRPPPVMPAPVPAPMPGMPAFPPSPDMEIRPVQWRQRGPQDYVDEDDEEEEEEEADGTNGRCLTEYDVLGEHDDDDDG